jgi:hypothetical protein
MGSISLSSLVLSSSLSQTEQTAPVRGDRQASPTGTGAEHHGGLDRHRICWHASRGEARTESFAASCVYQAPKNSSRSCIAVASRVSAR